MSNAKRVSHSLVLLSGNINQSSRRRRASSQAFLNAAAGIAAAGLLAMLSPTAKANISLFTTADDFSIDTGDGNGWTVQSSSAVAPSTTYDADGSTTNGAGNTTNAGGTGTAGSFQITPNGNISYDSLAQAPNNDQSNQTFWSAFDPGSVAAYTAASGYGQGTTTAYSGSLQYTYTVPTGSTGGYLQAGFVVNGLANNYTRYFASSTISNGTIDGQPAYTATIPYTIPAGNFGYFQFDLVFNTNYTFSGPMYVDAIQVVTAAAAVGSSQWITNGPGKWEDATNWSNGEPAVTGSSAIFDTDGGTITTNPVVSLSSSVTVDSLTFNTPTGGYTINSSGLGIINIGANASSTAYVTVLSGTHAINATVNVVANYTSSSEAIFNLSTGSSLSISHLSNGGYGNVYVNGGASATTAGGSLTVDNFNTANLNINGANFTTSVGGPITEGGYDNFTNYSNVTINTLFEARDLTADNTSTIMIGSAGSLVSETTNQEIDSTLSGTGSLVVGGGGSGANGENDTYAAATAQNMVLTGTNSNFSGPILVTNQWNLQIGGGTTPSSDAQLGNASATNTVTLDNGTLTILNAVPGSHPFVINSGGGTFNTGGFALGIGSLTGTGALTINGGGTVTVAAGTGTGIRQMSVGSLSIPAGAVVLASASNHSNHSLLTLGSLSLAGSIGSWSSLLDLGSNDLQVTGGGAFAQIYSQVKQGYANGAWNGSGGIASSAAAANASHITALGVIQSLGGTFDGVATSTSDVLVKYTYYGDTNLDGRVDGTDYSRVDVAFMADRSYLAAHPGGTALPSTGWVNGDFNYDGVVDGSDYTLMDNAYNSQSSAGLAAQIASPSASVTDEIAGTGISAAVPEPASLGLLGIGAMSLLGRRRNRHR